MTTNVPVRAAPMPWARIVFPGVACAAASVALPWFDPVLDGATGPDDLGYQYAGLHDGMWIIGFALVAACLGQLLATGLPVGLTGRYTEAYAGALCVVSGVVSGFMAYGSWHAHVDAGAGVELHRGVQAGFYFVIAGALMQIAVGLAVIAAGLVRARSST